MNNTQLYLAIGVPLIVNALGFTLAGIMLLWLKGDIKDVKQQVDMLVQYMISHEGRISVLEDRSKQK